MDCSKIEHIHSPWNNTLWRRHYWTPCIPRTSFHQYGFLAFSDLIGLSCRWPWLLFKMQYKTIPWTFVVMAVKLSCIPLIWSTFHISIPSLRISLTSILSCKHCFKYIQLNQNDSENFHLDFLNPSSSLKIVTGFLGNHIQYLVFKRLKVKILHHGFWHFAQMANLPIL